jgi:hypothetical protein
MIHIVIPEGLNRLDCAGQPLSDYSEACLRRVAEMAADGDAVCLAPGNAFGHPQPEDEIAAAFLQRLRPDLVTRQVGGTRRGYLDTLDNAVRLREWARRHEQWPMAECWLYCNRYHVVRTWLCFRVAGYQPRRIVACTPTRRSGLIVSRLKHYDYPAAYLVYEALAIGHTFLRLLKNFLRTGRLVPAEGTTH